MTPTLLQTSDPRVKLLALLVLSFQILFSGRWESLAGAALLLFVGVVLSPISLLTLSTKMLRVVWFLVFILVLNTFTLSGSVFIEVLGFYGTVEGLTEGMLLAARIVLLLIASLVFLYTTQLSDLMDTLENVPRLVGRLLNPLLVAAGLTINFVPVLIQSAKTIKQAQLARGVEVDGGFLRQVRFAFGAALPLFVSAFRASQHIAHAMEARLYRTDIERTPFRTLRLRARDYVLLGLLLLQLSASIWITLAG